MSSSAIYYTYKITNVLTGVQYIGKRRSIGVEPHEDLGVRYFSSSQDKEFQLDQQQNPQNYKYEVLNIFDDPKDQVEEEIRLHAEYDVAKNPMFYNSSKQTSTGFDTTGMIPVRNKTTGETTLVSREEFESDDELEHVTTGKILVRNTLTGENETVDIDNLSPHHETLVIVRNKQTKKSVKVTKSEFLANPNVYEGATKGTMFVRFKDNQKQKRIKKEDFDPSIHETLFVARDKRTAELVIVTKEEFKNGNYEATTKGTITARNKITGEFEQISSEVFFENQDVYEGNTSNSVIVREKKTGVSKRISSDEYHSDQTNYVSVMSDTVTVKNKKTGLYEQVACDVYQKNKSMYETAIGNMIPVRNKTTGETAMIQREEYEKNVDLYEHVANGTIQVLDRKANKFIRIPRAQFNSVDYAKALILYDPRTGDKIRVADDDQRFLKGELVGIKKKVVKATIDGEVVMIPKEDERLRNRAAVFMPEAR